MHRQFKMSTCLPLTSIAMLIYRNDHSQLLAVAFLLVCGLFDQVPYQLIPHSTCFCLYLTLLPTLLYAGTSLASLTLAPSTLCSIYTTAVVHVFSPNQVHSSFYLHAPSSCVRRNILVLSFSKCALLSAFPYSSVSRLPFLARS